MKKLSLFFAFVFCSLGNIFSQSLTVSNMLSNDSIEFKLFNRGSIWYDGSTYNSTYFYPKGSNKSPQFMASLWMGGFTTGGNLKLAAQNYAQSGYDYFSGPLDYTASTNNQTMLDWSKIWKVKRTTIANFVALVNSGNIPSPSDTNYTSIYDWPAYGNVFATGLYQISLTNALNNSNKTKEDFAPFVDVNNNGKYEPHLGEYPKIKGEEFAWWIFNDNGGAHTESYGANIGVEIAASAYVFNNHSILDNQSFYEFNIINRNSAILDSFIVGILDDVDMGYGFDDFVGTDSLHKIGYVYNSGNYDSIYDVNIPQAGIYYNSLYSSSDTLGLNACVFSLNNSSGITSFIYTNNFYNFMSGYWGDGLPFKVACNARDSGGVSTKFPYELNSGVSACSCFAIPHDKRIIMGSKPFHFIPNKHYTLSFAAVLRNQNYICSDLNPWQEVYDSITFAMNHPYLPLSISNTKIANKNISLSPNPAKSEINVFSDKENLKNAEINIVDILGQNINFNFKNKTVQLVSIDIEKFVSGIYFINIKINNTLNVFKFIKE